MYKKWKGSFTIEASFIMPLVLFLYLLIILTALFLYCRCAISQDTFLLAMRGERFTQGEEHYGEVIYGLQDEEFWQPQKYIEDRIERRKEFHPFFPAELGSCIISQDAVLVQIRQRGSNNFIKKESQKWNPVLMIRKWRREQNV